MGSHPVVVWPAAAFGWDPGDDLVWIGYIAGLAVYAVRWVEADALAVRLARVIDHLVYIRRAEVLAGAAEFLYAARIANIGVLNDEVGRLIFFMLGTRVTEVGELVEGELAVAFERTEQARFVAAVSRQHGELLHALITGGGGIAVAQAAPAGELLKSGMEHSGPESVLEALMEVTDLPEFAFDPACFDFLL